MGSAATTADGRRRLVAQSAASQWDMVIVGQSAFTAIGVSDDVRIDYISDQVDNLREQLAQAQTPRTKKRIELAIKSTVERLERLTAQQSKDTGLRFEHTGADYLFVDEAHHYKNKQRVCNIEELSCPTAAQRAEDLSLKLTVLRQRRRDEARAAGIPEHNMVERVATFATGTPIANSLGELWVMQTYLRGVLLEAAGVADLGDWGAAFTDTVTTVEINSTGTKLRPVTRVGKFTNLPELLALSAAYTDVVTRDQVPVALPKLVGGQRRVVTLKPDVEVQDFIADLGYRLDHLDPKDPAKDNQLKIANDGRNASLDPRLAHLAAPTTSRAAAVAEDIMRIQRAHADRVYHHPDTGAALPLTGPLQIAFCDRGTPSKNPHQFTIYKAIKDELIERGMPAGAIRFVHEARKPSEVAVLRAQCNRGEVSVLIGSTEKLGTGWNVQARLRALHHVDVPWRPCDLEQREGRIIRQGNQNDEVDIVNYVTEGTYDTVMWQKVEAKTVFIEQTRRNEVTDLEIEDLSGGDIGAAAAETKALATGDPRYLRQVQLQDDVKRLTALERAHHEAVRRRDFTVATLERVLPNRQADLEALAPVAARAAEHTASGSSPVIAVADRTHAERATAVEPFAAACRQAFIAGKDRGASRFTALGVSINGVEVLASRDLMHDMLLLRLAVPSRITEIKKDDLMATAGDGAGAKARGLLKRAENLYTDLPRHHEALRRELDRDRAELDDLLANPPGGFEQVGELTNKQAELASLTLELRLAAESPEAKAKAAAAQQRMAERGREPGWSLMLNPTPRVVEELGYPNAEALRTEVRQRERAAALQYAAQRDEAAAVQVGVLRSEVEVLEAAGGRAPAGMYRVPEPALQSLDEESVRAVIAIANSAQAVQPLHLGDGADKPAVLAAVTAAAHQHQHRVLALPATQQGADYAEAHRYADTTTNAAAGRDNLQSGRWSLPIGSLVIVDDADQLPAGQLRWLIDNAAATNTKLLLLTSDEDRDPAHTLTDVLTRQLPWAQHLGALDPTRQRPTAIEAATTHLAATGDDTSDAHRAEATELLARRDELTARYHTLAQPRTHHTDLGHDTGLEL